MNDKTETAVQETPALALQTAAPSVTAKQVWEIFRENFVVISGISVVLGFALSMTFLSAYLGVFDWHLIWFIQYPDIITFGLIGAGVILGSFVLLNAITQSVLGLKIMNGERAWKGALIFVSMWVLILVWEVYGQHLQPEPHYQLIFSQWVSVIFGVALVAAIAMYIRIKRWPEVNNVIGIGVVAVIATLSFGQWMGYSILYSSQFDQDVFLKTESIKDVKLIAVLSLNTIVMKDKKLYVFPNREVLKFQTADKPVPSVTPSQSPAAKKTVK